MSVGPDLVACHSTAAQLWGFDVLGAETLHFLGPPQLVNRARPGIQVHPSSLGCDDAVLVDGVWCTPAARTACDVVRLTAPIDGLATLDAALRSAWCTSDELAAAAAAQSGLRQVIRLRSLVPLADRRADSPMESRMRWRFVDGGLPVPDLQVRVSAEGRMRYLDTGWHEPRVGAEFDGVEAHMTAQQLRDDRTRHNWLTQEGWTLLHFTAIDVYRGIARWSRRRRGARHPSSRRDHEVREVTHRRRAERCLPELHDRGGTPRLHAGGAALAGAQGGHVVGGGARRPPRRRRSRPGAAPRAARPRRRPARRRRPPRRRPACARAGARAGRARESAPSQASSARSSASVRS